MLFLNSITNRNGFAAACGVISVQLPITDGTRIFVNADLIDAMHESAALNVFESGRLPSTRGMAFAGVPNLLLTSHTGGIAAEAKQRITRLTGENILKHLSPQQCWRWKISLTVLGAQGRTRTGTVFLPADFKSAASTNSATRAGRGKLEARVGIEPASTALQAAA